jgi:hypothetical protein
LPSIGPTNALASAVLRTSPVIEMAPNSSSSCALISISETARIPLGFS